MKAAAFLPPRDLQLSTFHIDGIAETAIWNLGEVHVSKPLGKPLYARGDFPLRAVPSQLTVFKDDAPLHHVTIRGWPQEKDAQLEYALAIALQAKLFLLAG